MLILCGCGCTCVGFRVTDVVVDTPTELVVEVMSTKKLSSCPFVVVRAGRCMTSPAGEIRYLEFTGRRTVLLIDETSIRKRHRYVTVVVNGDTGQVLSMFPGRSKAALGRFFIEQGPRWCHGGYRGSPTVPAPTAPPYTSTFPGPVTSWTGSTPPDGSPKDSLWYAGNCNAANRRV